MLTTDQSHLRKYLATLGVAIIVGAISLCGLFLRMQDDLLVNQSDLDGLTPVAKETIERRQHYIDLATTALPWFLIIGCLGGVVLSGYGIIGWARRQSIADELEEIAREKGKTELRRMTDQERVARIQVEAQTAAEEDKDAALQNEAAMLSDSKKAQGSTLEDDRSVERARVQLYDSYRRVTKYAERLIQFELDLAIKLEELLGPAYFIDIGVRVTRGNQRQEFDILARPIHAGKQYVFELKYLRNFRKSFRSVLTSAVSQATAGASLFELETVPVVVLVYEDSVTPVQLASAREYAQDLASTFISTPRIIILSADELHALSPQALSEAID